MVENFEQFTARAKRAMALAQEEARGFGHDYIGTEHILLGVAREEEGAAARTLAALGVRLDEIRNAVEFTIGRGGPMGRAAPTLVPRAKRALELALEEAQGLQHHYVGTEHLLIALLRVEDSVAAGILVGLGVTLAQVRQILATAFAPSEALEVAVRRLRGRRSGTDPAEARGNVVTLRVTDRDLEAIDALVESGIRATRSDAAAWLISAGIEAHRDLFTKLFATIGQIRQLRAEAQAIAQGSGATGTPPAPPAEDAPASDLSPLPPEGAG